MSNEQPVELSPEEPTLCHCGYAYHHQDFGGHWDIGCTNLNHPIRFRGYNEHDTKQMWEAYQLGYAERSAEAPKREVEQPDEYTVKELADAIGIAECLFKQQYGSLGSLESKWMHIASAIFAGLPKRESGEEKK